MRATYLMALVVVGTLCGCGKNQPPAAPTAQPAAQAVAQPPAPQPPTTAWTPLSPDVRDLARPAQPAAQPVQPTQPTPAVAGQPVNPAVPGGMPGQPPQPAVPNTEMVKAQKGVAAAGRTLDQHEGPLVTPAKAYFAARERIMFEATIPEALKLFKATNGAGPKNHAEFMAQVIQANQIQLPELPPGQEYVYDPQTEELNVKRPAR